MDEANALYVQPQVGFSLMFDPVQIDLSLGLRLTAPRNYSVAVDGMSDPIATTFVALPTAGLGLSVLSSL